MDIKKIIHHDKFKPFIDNMRNTFHTINKNDICPYHLENDIWSHSMMVLNYAINKFPNDDDLHLCCLFHDIGKIFNYVDDLKTNRRLFRNHWFYSGNIFRDFIIENKIFDINDKNKKKRIFNLYKVIQLHHFRKHISLNLRKNLNKDLNKYYYNLLIRLNECDIKGRITIKEIEETEPEKFNKYYDQNIFYLKNNAFENELIDLVEKIKKYFNKIAILPIGCPAAGKSTIARLLKNYFGDEFFNKGFDDIRIEVYSKHKYNNSKYLKKDEINTKTYIDAYNYCKNINIDLSSILNKELNEQLKRNKIVYSDNTHVTFKSRRRILNGITKEAFKIGLFIFSQSFNDVYKNNLSRNIKLDENIIKNMYYSINYPSFTEFDMIIVI